MTQIKLKVRRFPEFPYVVGHRGARSYAPENTIAGFQKGLSCGANLIECDVHLSRDGQVVVIHDDKVDRTSQKKSQSTSTPTPQVTGFVHNLTLKELQTLDVGNGEKIPTLFDALQWAKDAMNQNPAFIGFVVEIKTCPEDPRKTVGPVLETILAQQMTEKCMVISFEHSIVGEIKRLCPQIACGLLYGSPTELKSDIFDLCKQYHADMIWPSVDAVTPELVKLAHEKNLGVFTWVANTEKVMKKVIHAGVDGIGSDVPDLLRNL